MKRIVIAAAAVAALAGCGGGSQAPMPPSIQSVARQIGCAPGSLGSFTHSELFAHEEATCTLSGRSVEVAVFANNTLRDNWEKAASQFGAILKHGPGWAVVSQ